MKAVIIIFLLVLSITMPSTKVSAMEGNTIFAESDGTYTYREKNYSLEEFPVDQAISDQTGSATVQDSLVPVEVNIFPVEQGDIYLLRTLVRPLAVQFHRKGVKVYTRFLGAVIPYLFKKKSFFKPNQD